MYQRLRDLREDKDLKQRELASYLNISQTTYSRYESGELDIPSAALIKLADFYDVSVDYISAERTIEAMYRRLRDLREDADLTQQQLGDAINVPQRTYAYYESGQRMIPPHVLCALADYYGVSVDYILGRTDR